MAGQHLSHVADGVEKSLAIIHEPKLNAYLARLGAEMVQYADNRFAYGFTLYDDRNPPFAPLSRLMATPADGFGGEELEPVAIAGGINTWLELKFDAVVHPRLH